MTLDKLIVLIMVDRLNRALHEYQQAANQELAARADLEFALTLDQLVGSDVEVEYDPHCNMWFRVQRGVVYAW